MRTQEIQPCSAQGHTDCAAQCARRFKVEVLLATGKLLSLGLNFARPSQTALCRFCLEPHLLGFALVAINACSLTLGRSLRITRHGMSASIVGATYDMYMWLVADWSADGGLSDEGI